ncbi:MAG: ABC transporter ATP-binding protein, partial [Acidimicrobiia bacterium]
HESARYAERNTENTEEGIRTARITASMNGAIGAFSSTGLAVVVFFGALAVTNGGMTIGELLVFTTYTRGIYRPVKQMVKLAPKFTRASVGAERIGRLLEIEPEIQDAPGARAAEQLDGDVRFHRVSFAYENEQVLDDVSFAIAPGEHVALVGPSGAGKSTIVSLLLRLYDPASGVILIDGVSLAGYQQESLRREIGLVLQDSIMFGTSIRENISYGKPDAELAEIREAARLADIDDFIESLPDGYDTVLGEMGSTISGGQRQRLAIARALVKRPTLLLFDEPTASLDAASSAEVRHTITNLQRGRTVLVITHDVGLAQCFDRVMVLERGRIVEEGTPADLLEAGDAFRRMQRAQSGSRRNGASLPVPLQRLLTGAGPDSRRGGGLVVGPDESVSDERPSVLARTGADAIETSGASLGVGDADPHHTNRRK